MRTYAHTSRDQLTKSNAADILACCYHYGNGTRSHANPPHAPQVRRLMGPKPVGSTLMTGTISEFYLIFILVQLGTRYSNTVVQEAST